MVTDMLKIQKQLIILWGMIFRTLTIATIGFAAWIWFDFKNLGDVPFSQVTPNMAINNILGGGIPVGCFIWFFNFPKNDIEYPDFANGTYEIWAKASGYVLLIPISIWLWLQLKLLFSELIRPNLPD